MALFMTLGLLALGISLRIAAGVSLLAERARAHIDRFGPWPATAALSCAAVALTTWGWTSSPLRPAVTTWFLLVCPGMALVRLLPQRGLVLRFVLAVATGVALETVVATTMAEAKIWSAGAALAIFLIVTLVGTGLDVRSPSASRTARPR